MGFSLGLQTEFLEGGGYLRRSGEAEPVAGTNSPWVFASCAQGLSRCVLPLLSEQDEPAEYTVRLYFAELENQRAGKRVFDVKLQGEIALGGFDVVKEAGSSHKAVVRELRGVQVSSNLEIELVPRAEATSSMSRAPILSGVEVLRAEK